MLPDPFDQIARRAAIERAIATAGEKIDTGLDNALIHVRVIGEFVPVLTLFRPFRSFPA